MKIGKIWDLYSLSHGSSEERTHVFPLLLTFFSVLLQLKHPNVVKYYKTFLEGDYDFLLCPFLLLPVGRPQIFRVSDPGDRLYVVMELIEGEPLAEHLASLREKQQRFTEERIWNIFIQVETFPQRTTCRFDVFGGPSKNSFPDRETGN